MKAAKPRGGARKGTGPKTDRSRKVRPVTLKIYEDQHPTLKASGGSAWLRTKLDQEMGQIQNCSPEFPQDSKKGKKNDDNQ
jgi:hypothetical protein